MFSPFWLFSSSSSSSSSGFSSYSSCYFHIFFYRSHKRGHAMGGRKNLLPPPRGNALQKLCFVNKNNFFNCMFSFYFCYVYFLIILCLFSSSLHFICIHHSSSLIISFSFSFLFLLPSSSDLSHNSYVSFSLFFLPSSSHYVHVFIHLLLFQMFVLFCLFFFFLFPLLFLGLLLFTTLSSSCYYFPFFVGFSSSFSASSCSSSPCRTKTTKKTIKGTRMKKEKPDFLRGECLPRHRLLFRSHEDPGESEPRKTENATSFWVRNWIPLACAFRCAISELLFIISHYHIHICCRVKTWSKIAFFWVKTWSNFSLFSFFRFFKNLLLSAGRMRF